MGFEPLGRRAHEISPDPGQSRRSARSVRLAARARGAPSHQGVTSGIVRGDSIVPGLTPGKNGSNEAASSAGQSSSDT